MLFVADGFFLGSPLRARLNRQQSLRHSVEMTDRGPPVVLSNRGQNAQTNHDLYVDNIGIVNDHVAEVHVALKENKQDCEKRPSYATRNFRELWFWSSPWVLSSTSSSCGPFPPWYVLVASANGSDVV